MSGNLNKLSSLNNGWVRVLKLLCEIFCTNGCKILFWLLYFKRDIV